jgi:hypothetical protein
LLRHCAALAGNVSYFAALVALSATSLSAKTGVSAVVAATTSLGGRLAALTREMTYIMYSQHDVITRPKLEKRISKLGKFEPDWPQR